MFVFVTARTADTERMEEWIFDLECAIVWALRALAEERKGNERNEGKRERE